MERVQPTDEKHFAQETRIPLDYTPIYDVPDEQSLFSKLIELKDDSQRGAHNASV